MTIEHIASGASVATWRDRINATIDEANKVPFKADMLVYATARPGDASGFFTASLSSSTTVVSGEASGEAALAGGTIATAAEGKVYRITGSAIVGPRADIHLTPGTVSVARWGVSRATMPADPLGDAVQYRIAWLAADKSYISSTLVDEYNILPATGVRVISATVSRDMDADYTAPTNARYMRPYVQIFGGAGTTTDVEFIYAYESNGLPGPQGNEGDITEELSTARDEAVQAAEDAVNANLNRLRRVATRTALKALNTSDETAAYLTEAGREGVFVWKTGDYSSLITADTYEGLYIKADAIASSSGAWVRIYNGRASAKWFGALGDDTADDTAKINSFLSLVKFGTIPAGTYKVTASLAFQSDQDIEGADDLTVIRCAGAATGGILNFDTRSDTRVSKLTVRVPYATYTTTPAISLDTCTSVHVSDIKIDQGGSYPVLVQDSAYCSVKRVTIENGYNEAGIQVNACNYCEFDENIIRADSLGKYGIQLNGGNVNKARGNRIFETPDNYFGIHSFSCSYAEVDNNFIQDTRREAIAGGGSCVGMKIRGNTCLWTQNLGTGDFGISCAGYSVSAITGDFEVSGNTIINSALDGIGIAGYTQRGLIMGNTIRDSAYANASGFYAGIRLYGWESGGMTEDMLIIGNTITKIASPGLLYSVYETPGLGSVARNIVASNHSFGLATDPVFLTASSSMRSLNSDDLPTLSFTSTVTASGGSITSATGTLRYQFTGKLIHCILTITVSNNGTGFNQLVATLPFAPTGALSGRETAVNSKTVVGVATGGAVYIVNYDNSYPGVTGGTYTLSGILRLP